VTDSSPRMYWYQSKTRQVALSAIKIMEFLCVRAHACMHVDQGHRCMITIIVTDILCKGSTVKSKTYCKYHKGTLKPAVEQEPCGLLTVQGHMPVGVLCNSSLTSLTK